MKKKTATTDHRPAVHIVHRDIVQPYNPVTVNLIGAGGTGSQVLTNLARINHALQAFDHPGLFVRVFDDDQVTAANLGRQLFTTAEVGQYKSVALINRINRFFGTNWKAETVRFDERVQANAAQYSAALNISCVDNAATRFEISKVLCAFAHSYGGRSRALYWLDFGNSRQSGQAILCTLDAIKQPKSEQFRTVERLPLVTEEFREMLLTAEETDDTPSCSLAEALAKQDLFINTALAGCGASLLWQMIREGMIVNRGFFLNLNEYRTQPLKVA